MYIGVPKEIKPSEYRVGLTPSSVRELVALGHQVLVETQAGAGIGATDEVYAQAGARLVSSAADVFAQAGLIVKVKEPQPPEVALLGPQHVLFTYLHLAAAPALTRALAASGACAIAYETVTAPDGSLPLLAPMSEVAGRLAITAGARCLEREMGGSGLLLGGVPGVPAAQVVVLGGGVVGTSPVTASSKPVFSCTSATVTPGCTDLSRMRRSGVSKSITPNGLITQVGPRAQAQR